MKPAQYNHLTGNQFFLIRQTANLMEDFVREIGNTSSLFLLYGDQSVGKSWLLRELTSKRFDHDNIHWIDFMADAASAKSGKTGSKPEQGRGAGDISKLLESAKEGELIIVDHFELASNKARHALFQSWITDGIDKKLNLIIAASTDSFNEVRQLAQQHQLEVRSFQLLPYNAAEIEAFLGFYLFPDNPFKPLLIPAEVSKQIKNCRGVIGEVAEVATQQENKITQNLKPEIKSNSRILVGVMLSLLLLAAVAYGFLKPAGQNEIVTVSEPETVESKSSNDVVESIVDSPVTLEPAQQEDIVESSETPQPAIPVEGQSVNQLAPDTDAEPDQLSASAKAEQPEKSAQDTRVKGIEESLLEGTGRYSLRFQQELGDTLSWIRQIDKNRSTIQIMSLRFGDSTDVTYHRYLEKLKKLGIDIAQIKIYPTRRNGSILFGVIYGEYDNRTEAVEQIRQLPEELKANRPIPRTMGGIWNDINR